MGTNPSVIDIETGLRRLAALGARDPACAAAVEHIERLLAGRAFRLARRDRAIVELSETYYAIGSRRAAARSIATALARFAARREREPWDAREALLAVIVEASNDNPPGEEAVRKIIALGI